MTSARDQVADPVIVELRKLLPKGIHVNQAMKIHRDEIRDLLYQLYTEAYEEGDSEGYDRGYDDAYEGMET